MPHKFDSPDNCSVSSVESSVMSESAQIPSVVCPVTFNTQTFVVGTPDVPAESLSVSVVGLHVP